MTEAVALCKQVVGPVSHRYLFCSALAFGKCYKVLSRTRKEKDINCEPSKEIEAKEGEGNKIAVFDIDNVPMHYIQKLGNKMSRKLIRKAHRIDLRKEDVNVWREVLSYWGVIFHGNHDRHGRVCMRSSW